VIPLDASIVRGSHGLAAADPVDRPVLIGTGHAPFEGESGPMAAVFDAVLGHFGIDSSRE
jgi:hypothetical protein